MRTKNRFISECVPKIQIRGFLRDFFANFLIDSQNILEKVDQESIEEVAKKDPKSLHLEFVNMLFIALLH